MSFSFSIPLLLLSFVDTIFLPLLLLPLLRRLYSSNGLNCPRQLLFLFFFSSFHLYLVFLDLILIFVIIFRLIVSYFHLSFLLFILDLFTFISIIFVLRFSSFLFFLYLLYLLFFVKKPSPSMFPVYSLSVLLLLNILCSHYHHQDYHC